MIPEDEKRRRVLDAVTGRKPYKKDRISVPLVCMAFVLFLLSGLLLAGVVTVTGAELPDSSVEYGESWVKWSFPFVNASIYLDGKLVMDDNDLGYYLLYGVDAREKHVIDVYDLDNETFYYHESMTLMSFSHIFLVIGFIIGCVWLGLLAPYMPIVGFIPATGLLMYLIDNNFEGWLILFVAFLWLACLLYGFERLENKFGAAWRGIKRK